MNYKKIVLVGCISAFVAILTSIMGVAGTIIGSVISSVLYNMLTEALEAPIGQATFSRNFEWEIAYIFPIVVIALIQLLLIAALLSEVGILPYTFLNAFLSLQHFADNNLYRVLGLALIVMSVYPLVLKPDIIKKSNGAVIAFVGLIFLARGFVDLQNSITQIYDGIFSLFDLPIAILAFLLLCVVIGSIVVSARNAEKEYKVIKHNINREDFKKSNVGKTYHSKKHSDFDYADKRNSVRRTHQKINKSKKNIENDSEIKFKSSVGNKSRINKSSDSIHFESNDLLDDYK